jgi:hypothetical protein
VSGRIDAAAIAFSIETRIGRNAENLRNVWYGGRREIVGRYDRNDFMAFSEPSPSWGCEQNLT